MKLQRKMLPSRRVTPVWRQLNGTQPLQDRRALGAACEGGVGENYAGVMIFSYVLPKSRRD